MNRVPGVTVTPYVLSPYHRTVSDTTYRYYGKIQDKDDDYYMQFNLVICGLDSVEARRWINATLVNMVDPENPESLKPLIDGGTEGHFGSVSPFRSVLIPMTTHRVQGTSPCHLAYGVILLRMLS